MNSVILYVVSFIVHILPETRCFAFKRFLYKLAGAKIAKGVRICSSATILGNGDLSIGENTWIGSQVLIVTTSKVVIGANVDIAPRVYIGTGSHVIDPVGSHTAGEGFSASVVICDGVWLCASTTILPGVTVGNKALVAAGSTVTKDINPYEVVGGCPAKCIKNLK